MAERFSNPAPQFFYSNSPATPLAGGLMYFYVPGTDTPKDTYSDNALSIANANPVVLTASGVLPNVFLDGSYKVNLTDRSGVQQPGWPRDSVNSIQGLAFANWDATITYGEGGANIVTASNGKYYVSIQGNNLAHEPSISPLWWSLWPFPSEAKGVIFAGNDTGIVALGPGTNGDLVVADSTQPGGIKFQAPAAITAATQAQMEAATSNVVTVTPLAVKWHPGVDKAWLKATGDGSTLLGSYNITSITDSGTGLLTVSLTVNFSSVNYEISPGACGPYYVYVNATPGTTGFQLVSVDIGTGLQADPTFYYASAAGDQ